MAYVRLKKVKSNYYGYLVENKYRKKGPKQKVKKYLGRVSKPNLVYNIDFLKFFDVNNIKAYVKNRNKTKVINDLVKWELFKHGFDKDQLDDNEVLKINEGLLCNYHIRKLKRFNISGDERKVGTMLAEGFVNTGIKVPEELFVEYFKRFVR
ncbi:MAG: hypothetical protein V1740_08375 [Candidatus Woesearchaeota archaeon]